MDSSRLVVSFSPLRNMIWKFMRLIATLKSHFTALGEGVSKTSLAKIVIY